MRSSHRAASAFVLCGATACGLAMIGIACASFDADVPTDAALETAADAATDAALETAADAATDARGADADAGFDPVSCADAVARDPSLHGQSRRYTIDPDGPGGKPPFLVYCEMTLDDGGWTVVARSSIPSATFGWSAPAGDVTNVAPAYALDVIDAGLTFTEVMVADRKAFEYAPATHAYKFPVPPNFVVAYRNAPLPTVVTTALGDCTVGGGPAGLRYVGYTARTDHFFFGDNPGTDTSTGLWADVFRMSGTDCASGGSLDGLQGLVFVR